MEERREAVEIIRRFVRGEIEEEPLLGFARRLEIHSLHQLSETIELRSEDFRRIGFRREDLVRLLELFLEGRMGLDALRGRVRRMSQIFSTPEYFAASVYRPELGEALSILTLLLDPEAPLSPGRIRCYLIPVLSALVNRKPLPFPSVMRRLLRDMGRLHFRSLTPFEHRASRGRRVWSDLALLYHPPEGPLGAASGESCSEELGPVWFIPLAVATRSFYRKEMPVHLARHDNGCGTGLEAWMHPENCLMARLLERHPWLEVSGRRPAYLVDPRGFAEIVLDLPLLSRQDLAFAVRLFALHNGAKAASLDGQPVELYPSHPRIR